MPPAVVKELLAAHIAHMRQLHRDDLANGFGRVYVPRAAVEAPTCQQRMMLAMGLRPHRSAWTRGPESTGGITCRP
jgi:hypothetical protein